MPPFSIFLLRFRKTYVHGLRCLVKKSSVRTLFRLTLNRDFTFVGIRDIRRSPMNFRKSRDGRTAMSESALRTRAARSLCSRNLTLESIESLYRISLEDPVQ